MRRTKNPQFTKAAGAVAILFGLFFLVRLFVETPSQQIERRLKDIAKGVKAKKVKDVMENFADDFKHEPALPEKKTVEAYLTLGLDTEGVQEIAIWDIKVEIPKAEEGAKPKAIATFAFKGKGYTYETVPHWICKAIFERQPDGKWLLKDFETPRDSVTNQPVTIPTIGQ